MGAVVAAVLQERGVAVMSISREHYQAQLEVLRRVYQRLRFVEADAGTQYASGLTWEEAVSMGREDGYKDSADLILLYIKDVQRALRRICGVEKKCDRIYRGGAR
jgi:hypothetical protein